MGIKPFTDFLGLSDEEIYAAISSTETDLFQLRLKKATRQNFKSHEIKKAKRILAQLKTILTSRL